MLLSLKLQSLRPGYTELPVSRPSLPELDLVVIVRMRF
jgi:hypothetical protein